MLDNDQSTSDTNNLGRIKGKKIKQKKTVIKRRKMHENLRLLRNF